MPFEPCFQADKITGRFEWSTLAMPTKTAGTQAPQVSLSTADGETYNLREALIAHKFVVLAFFKSSCPVCQLAMPYLQRLHQTYPEVPIWGISQDDESETVEFAKQYGVTLPLLLDKTLSSTVEFGLVSVPSIFAVERDGSIGQAIFGFARTELEQLNSRMAQLSGRPEKQLFTEQDDVPTLRPG